MASKQDLEKAAEIYKRSTKSERYGYRFGVFPAWTCRYGMSVDRDTELMRLSIAEFGEPGA